MILIVRVTGPEVYWNYPQYAVVDVNKALKNLISQRKEIFQMAQAKDCELLEMQFNDYSITLIESIRFGIPFSDIEQNDIFQDNGYGELEKHPDPEGANYVQAEGACMILRDKTFCWGMFEEDQDVWISTIPIPYSFLFHDEEKSA